MLALALATLLLTGCAPGIVRMGLRLKLDVLGVKVDFKLPLEVFPLQPDGGYPPEHVFKD